MKYTWLTLLLSTSAAHAVTPVTYTFRALAEHGASSSSKPTLFPPGAAFRVTVIVDADAVGSAGEAGIFYEGGIACSNMNVNPPVIAVYVNGDLTRNYGGGACTTIGVSAGGITMSSADLGIGQTFSATFTAAGALDSYAIPKHIGTALHFSKSTYSLGQPFGPLVSGDWASE